MKIALGLALAVLVPMSAHATVSEIFGGPGGGLFTLTCRDNSVLVGFEARAGAWVDAVGIICSPLDPRTHRPTGQRSVQGWAGGTGGAPQEAYCAAGSSLTGIGLAHTRGKGLQRQYVNTIGLVCQGKPEIERCISSGEGCTWIAPIIRGPVISIVKEYAYDRIQCPAGEVATGVTGRAGKYVDALGLICREPNGTTVRGR